MKINDYRSKSYKKTLCELDAGNVFYFLNENDDKEENLFMVLDCWANIVSENGILCVRLADGCVCSYDGNTPVQLVKSELTVYENL